MEITDLNFTEDLTLKDTEINSLVIGYTPDCYRCKDLINELDKQKVKYGKINLKKSEMFSELIALKCNLLQLNVPLITIYKDKKFIKKIPNKFPVNHILLEINNL